MAQTGEPKKFYGEYTMYEPALHKATEKQQFDFRKIFLKGPESFAVTTDGREPVKDLHAKRSEIRKMARGLLGTAEKEKRQLNESEESAFDTCTYLLDDIQYAFDLKQERSVAERGIMGASGGNRGSCVTNSQTVEMWQDAKTGRSIAVLGGEHRFQDFTTNSGGHQFSARDYLAGLVGHTNNEEVRAALSTSSDTAGGYMVPEHVSAEVIDLMRSKNTAIAAGARSFPMSESQVRICRLVENPTASWVGESNQIPEDSAMSIGALTFHAKKLTTLIKASTELLQDASNAGVVIQNAIASAMSLELDRAVYYGVGTVDPLGIFNDSEINVYELGTGNGGALSGYDDILYGVKKIIESNGQIPTTCVMSPRTLVDYSLLKDGEGLPLVKPDLIKNIQFFDTTKIPNNETVGTSSNCSSILLGTFQNMVIGIRSNLQLKILEERYADFGQVGFLATLRADMAVFQPKAFCKITGIRPLA